MNFAKLPFYVWVLGCFAIVCFIAFLRLPEGPPRFIAAGIGVALAAFVAVKAVRDYNKPQ